MQNNKSAVVKRKPIFITGIGTGVGKTVTSAIFVEKLQADYWKPVQAGDLHHTDTDQVRSLVGNQVSVFHPEAYRLTQPFSPHKSAVLDHISINLEHIMLPQTDNLLIIEGAGGLMVPLNDKDLMIDLIKKFDAEVILVIRHYLGSINHSLLSLMALKNYGITCKGIIYNGLVDEYSESFINNYENTPVLGYVPLLERLDHLTISEIQVDL